MKMKREQQLSTLAEGLVSTMYDNGGSPLHRFGTSWEKLSKVEHDNPMLFDNANPQERKRYGQ